MTPSPGSTSRRDARSRRGVDRGLIAVALAGISTFVDVYSTQPLLPYFRRVFGATEMDVSLTVSATTVGIALAAPIVGLVAEKYGRKRVIVPAIFGLSVPTVLAATSTSLHGLIAWRFLQGLFIPGIIAVILAYIGEEWEGRGVGRAMAAYIAGTVLGGFLGRFLSGVIATQWNWRASFAILGAGNLVCAALVRRWLRPSTVFVRGRRAADILRETMAHFRNPRLLANFGMGFGLLFSLVGAFTYVNFHLAAAPYNLNSAQLGGIFFVYLFGVFVTPLGGALLDRAGFRTTACTAAGMSLAGLALTLHPDLWVIVVGLTLYSSGLFISQASATVQTGRVAGAARSSAAGLYVTLYYVGGSLGALAPAWLWGRYGWPGCVAIFSLGALFTLAAGLGSAAGLSDSPPAASRP